MHETKCWHELDEFWDTVEPVLFSDRRMENAPVEVDRIINLLKTTPGQHVLDLCCGVGRHTLELARRGFHATGLDRTQKYLDRAVSQARQEGLEVEFIHGDMRTFSDEGRFDVILNYFTSFGYFNQPKDDTLVVNNVLRSLKKGGIFLMDMMGKEVLAKVFRERDWREEGGILILEERKIRGNWSIVESRWIMIRGEERKEVSLALRLYSAVELGLMLSNAGFRDVDVYGDIDGNPYDDTAKRLVVVARK